MSVEKQLNECPNFNPFDPSTNIDKPPSNCDPCQDPTQQSVSFDQSVFRDKYGLGKQQQCDPMQTGQIVNDLTPDPNRKVIYRYPKSIRGCNEAMLDLFSNIVVIDEQGTAHKVPIMWGTQERAVIYAIGENIRPDNSLVVDRLRLPLLAVVYSDISYNMDRYTYHHSQNFFRDRHGRPGVVSSELRDRDTIYGFARGIPVDISYQLTAWTYFTEDMNQILESVLLKFSPIAYIKVQGVQWTSIVKLDGLSNNIDLEPGQGQRVIKFQFNMTVEHYIPQPISRYKSVLETRIDYVDSVNDQEITGIIS